MGIFARLDILERYGIDIGDGDLIIEKRPIVGRCPKCNRPFYHERAVADHLKDKHGIRPERPQP